jgi:hypothetical protein
MSSRVSLLPIELVFKICLMTLKAKTYNIDYVDMHEGPMIGVAISSIVNGERLTGGVYTSGMRLIHVVDTDPIFSRTPGNFMRYWV